MATEEEEDHPFTAEWSRSDHSRTPWRATTNANQRINGGAIIATIRLSTTARTPHPQSLTYGNRQSRVKQRRLDDGTPAMPHKTAVHCSVDWESKRLKHWPHKN